MQEGKTFCNLARKHSSIPNLGEILRELLPGLNGHRLLAAIAVSCSEIKLHLIPGPWVESKNVS
jgi:hypothetical protein